VEPAPRFAPPQESRAARFPLAVPSRRGAYEQAVVALALRSKIVYILIIFDMKSSVTSRTFAVACCAPLGSPVLSDDEADATASLFRSLSDPARVKIVNLLATSDEPVCICNLTDPLGLSQPTVSHHMKKLHDVGLVDREQRGKWAYFSLKDDALHTLAAVADLKGVTVR
jgi:ArsR family transcriptional regulator, arsenate/arsenite/antimonite-responsive transcriptional repressor